MLAAPSDAVIEAFSRELQRTWLAGKVYSTWSLPTLQENFPSQQVVKLILFQIESKVLQQMQDMGFWDWEDGQLIAQMGNFFDRIEGKLALSPAQLSTLLYNALYHSLQILLRPQAALGQFYFGQRAALMLEEFGFYTRYVVYFDFLPSALLSYAERQGLKVIDKKLWEEKAPRVLTVYEEETQEPIEAYQKRLLEELVQKKWPQIQEHWQRLEEQSEDLIKSVITEDTGEDVLLKNLFGTSPKGPSEAGEVRARNPLLSAIDYEPRQVLRERFQAPPRRADTLKRFDLDAIPIHKQFVFIQRIFEGDPIAFRQALERLNQAHSLQEAQALLQTWRSPQSDPQTFQEFEKWVISRFST